MTTIESISAMSPITSAPPMDLFTAITTRRSVGRVGPEVPPRALIEQIIEAAVWAPNHHLTEPWRFFVLTGEARAAFGAAMAEGQRPHLDPALSATRVDDLLAKASAKALRAPVIITIAVEPAPNAVEFEEITAGAAAVQNMLLAAHALGLGAIWRTGGPAYAPAVKGFFGLTPNAHLLGFVYLGWPSTTPPIKQRQAAASKTRWLGWDDAAE